MRIISGRVTVLRKLYFTTPPRCPRQVSPRGLLHFPPLFGRRLHQLLCRQTLRNYRRPIHSLDRLCPHLWSRHFIQHQHHHRCQQHVCRRLFHLEFLLSHRRLSRLRCRILARVHLLCIPHLAYVILHLRLLLHVDQIILQVLSLRTTA